MLKNEQIIYIGNDWFADNKTSSHQIATLLAEHNDILYVEAAGQRAPKASKRDIGKIFRKLSQAWSNPVNVYKRLHRFSPIILPFHRFALVRRINKSLLGWSIRRAARKVGFTDPILWVILPHYSSLVDTIERKGTVYYVVDEYSSLPDVDPERIKTMEQKILRAADVVFTVSEVLTDRKKVDNPNTYFSPHGVDTSHFQKSLDESLQRPADLANIPGPIAGFFGLIEAWVDLELIAHMAKARPNCSFVLIGRVARDTSCVSGLPNVYLLGQRPYPEMPAYLRYFDVTLIPFVVNDVIINSNPLKLKEYLAGGKPVITVPIRAVDDYRSYIYVAETYDEFIDCLDRALEEDSPDRVRERVEAMVAESWPAKVEIISERVSKHIQGVHNE